jgi:glycosyltransferase 2 family protein
MKKYWSLLKNFIFLIIFILVSFFFYNEILRNYDSISSIAFKFNYGFLALAGICIASISLSATLAWHVLIHSFPVEKKLTLLQSFSITNISALLKYIPGKVWTYAVQLYLIRDLCISKYNFLLIFLVINVFSLSIQTALGLFILIFLFSQIWVKLLLLAGCLVLFVISFYVIDVVNILISLTNKIFKKDFPVMRFPLKKILWLQAIYFAAIILFAASGYFTAIGIGMFPTFREALSIIGAGLISSVIGYVVVIAPGGLGIRELVMYWILNSVSNKSLALVLPIATRLLMMLVDLIFGILGLLILRARKNSA